MKIVLKPVSFCWGREKFLTTCLCGWLHVYVVLLRNHPSNLCEQCRRLGHRNKNDDKVNYQPEPHPLCSGQLDLATNRVYIYSFRYYQDAHQPWSRQLAGQPQCGTWSVTWCRPSPRTAAVAALLVLAVAGGTVPAKRMNPVTLNNLWSPCWMIEKNWWRIYVKHR